MYRKRFYRQYFKGENLQFFNVTVEETDLMIGADRNISKEAECIVKEYRSQIKSYIKRHPDYYESLVPVKAEDDAPVIIKRMCDAARAVSVGPMAAVAGAVAQMTGMELLHYCRELIIENGGDIFLKTEGVRRIGVFAGESVLSETLALEIRPEMTPIGVCTSSGTVGHSLSMGKADAVVVIAKDAFLADAAATSVCNRIQSEGEFESALGYALGIRGVEGVLAILGDKMAVRGNVKLVPFDCRANLIS